MRLIKKKFYVGIFAIISLFILHHAHAQENRIVDQVVSIVGDKIILQSDIETQFLELRAQGASTSGDMKCEILEEFLVQKLLLNQAEIDSILVSEAEVELQLNQRLDYFIGQIGSQKALEEYFGKSILEIKEDFRDVIREQIITQKMQGEIVGNLAATPAEVRKFYNRIPEDSLPRVNSQVEISQIVIYPPLADEAVFSVKERLLDLRKRIIAGEDFTTLAVLYSEDPGSSPRGGEIGFLGKGELDPAYAKTAFSLKEGTVSTIVESEFGYHIIQLIERQGDKVNTRHILLKPKVTAEASRKTLNKLDSITQLIRTDTLTFKEAARYYSQDEKSRVNGGIRVNPANQTTQFEMDEFQPAEFRVIRQLKVGEISEPIETVDEKGKKVYKVVKLTSQTKPHVANLEEDFNMLKEMTLMQKQQQIVENWVQEKKQNTYIRIDKSFSNCEFKRNWTNN